MPTPQNEMLADAQLFCSNVYGFAQKQPNCLGWTSLWLRCRLKEKEFWESKFVPAAMPADIDIGCNFDISVSHWEATEASSNKSLQLQASFPAGGQFLHADYITSGKRTGKDESRAKELATVRYESRRDLKALPGKVPQGRPEPVFEPFKHVVDLAVEKHYLVRLSMVTTTREGLGKHSIAIDCRDAGCIRYFDPNVGEMQFMSSVYLIDWWICWYRKGVGAFRVFNGTFTYEYYVVT